MAGNVWEWTNSDYAKNSKVGRGGAWQTKGRDVGSTYRDGGRPSVATDSLGFRCVAVRVRV